MNDRAEAETASPAETTVVRVTPEHHAALAGFYREVWDPEAKAEDIRNPPPTWLVLKENRAIGHVTTIPVSLLSEGTERPAHWVKGLWVLPEYQRSAVGFLLLKEAVRSLGYQLALAHEPAAIRLFQALGFTDVGVLSNHLRVMNARALFSKLDVKALGLGGLPALLRPALALGRITAPVSGPVADSALGIWARLAGKPSGNLRLNVTDRLDEEAADALWQAVRGTWHTAVSRTGAYLTDRYDAHDYVFATVTEGDQLSALAIVRRPREAGDQRLNGIRVAPLSELIYPANRPALGLAALEGAELAARQVKADALLCSVSADAPRSLMRRRGYVALPGNLHLLAKPAEGAVPPLDRWWVTRGDSLGDETF